MRSQARQFTLQPMLASIGRETPTGEGWVFEPKYDGIRALAIVARGRVALLSRNGNDKTAQFPEIAAALADLAADASDDVFALDGEIVPTSGGEARRFQELQGRMHATDLRAVREHARTSPAAYYVFDCLAIGGRPLLDRPWGERRRRLEELFESAHLPGAIRLVEVSHDAEALLDRARREGWEGIIAKRADALYEPGRRSSAWRKLKVEHVQEFVVGGWTEPRRSRAHLGALLIGYYDGPDLVFAGAIGTGFNARSLADAYARLRPLERRMSPFAEVVRTSEPAHWTAPTLVAQVRFSEWTADGKLRHPVFLGFRDDKSAREVTAKSVREPIVGTAGKPAGRPVEASPASAASDARTIALPLPRVARGGGQRSSTTSNRRTAGGGATERSRPGSSMRLRLLTQLTELEDAGGSGTIRFTGGPLELSNLEKVFWPDRGFTKGDLMRYYVAVSPALLPAINDRPLVLRRFPNGIRGKAFYQQHLRHDVPEVVRVGVAEVTDGDADARLIGGDLATLLYAVQLGAISIDPWHSRLGSLDAPDYAIIDLDPGPEAPFALVVEIAQQVREELRELDLISVPKTSGSTGIHIGVPLPAGTNEEAARLLAELVATHVAHRRPRDATIERTVARRPPGAVYVDFLQNIRGKTVAAAYSARAVPGAVVSAPLRWEELTERLDPRAFTIETMPSRLAEVGDLWAPVTRGRNSLRRLTRG